MTKKNNFDDLLNIDGIGETQLSSIKSFFANKTNVKVLSELGKVLKIKNAILSQSDGILKNKSFLVTGKLNGISRAEVKSLIEENSGTIFERIFAPFNLEECNNIFLIPNVWNKNENNNAEDVIHINMLIYSITFYLL